MSQGPKLVSDGFKQRSDTHESVIATVVAVVFVGIILGLSARSHRLGA